MNEPVFPPELPKPLMKRFSATVKMIGIAVLVLALLIPMSMIRSVVSERQTRRDSAIAEITATWGREQTVIGPVLVAPYDVTSRVWKDKLVNGKIERVEVDETVTALAYFLPADLSVAGDVTPSLLHRGIYDAVVYKGALELTGRFAEPDFEALGVPADTVRRQEAVVTLAIADLRGIGEVLEFDWGGESLSFSPGCRLAGHGMGLHARVPDLAAGAGETPFRITLALKGSREIRFAPVGRQTRVTIRSPWPDPSFRGAFLPADRRVTPDGFEAVWELSWYGRSYPQQATDRARPFVFGPEAVGESLFGVAFLSPVDAYRMVERATKYGVLFIALLFTAFFLFEILAGLRIHAFQYTLVGAALCLFYLALLSLSEFLRFAIAYWLGAAACSLLIVLYSMKVLKGGARTGIVALALAAIFAYLYVVLQMQDYSLLFGTAGLFAVLALVMYATRNVDWYGRE